jgi:hypothetical protein
MVILAQDTSGRSPARSSQKTTTVMLALQLFLPASSESMGNHDSDIVDADGVG